MVYYFEKWVFRLNYLNCRFVNSSRRITANAMVLWKIFSMKLTFRSNHYAKRLYSKLW